MTTDLEAQGKEGAKQFVELAEQAVKNEKEVTEAAANSVLGFFGNFATLGHGIISILVGAIDAYCMFGVFWLGLMLFSSRLLLFFPFGCSNGFLDFNKVWMALMLSTKPGYVDQITKHQTK